MQLFAVLTIAIAWLIWPSVVDAQPPPVVAGVIPSSGPVGFAVTIFGSNFQPGFQQVNFGSVTAAAPLMSNPNQLVVVTPMNPDGPAVITVIVNGIDNSGQSKPIAFIYTGGGPPPEESSSSSTGPAAPAGPMVTNMHPNASPTAGGILITILGSDFQPATGGVTFGGVGGTIQTWTDSQILVVTPPGSAGQVNVVVTRLSDSATANTVLFTYTDAPVIFSQSAKQGPPAGGTVVTFNGINFGATQGTGSITVGGAPAQINTWASDAIEFVTPPGAASGSPVPIVLTCNDAQTVTLNQGFLYFGLPPAQGGSSSSSSTGGVAPPPAPVIQTLLPKQGHNAGGTVVTLSGVNFGNTQGMGSVTFDGIAAAAYGSWTDNQIVVTTPAPSKPDTTVSVVVTADNGQASNPGPTFSYSDTPALQGVFPPRGPTAGGTIVTVMGFNFGATQGTGSVTFGGTSAAVGTWSDSQIIATTPPGTAGSVAVVVTVDGGQATPAGASFTYSDAAGPAINTLTPSQGTTAGGFLITIAGTSFGTLAGSVFFAETQTPPASSWTDTQIVVTVPAGAGLVGVTVVRAGDSAISGASPFQYLGTPVVNDIIPASGPCAGGITVTIDGSNFGTTQSKVNFDSNSAAITSWTDTQIIVTLPAHAASGAVSAGVERLDLTAAGITFNYIAAPNILGISPSSGTSTAFLTITGTDFGPTTGVLKNSGFAVPTIIWSNGQIVFHSPPVTTDMQVVVTSVVDGQSSNTFAFTYTALPDQASSSTAVPSGPDESSSSTGGVAPPPPASSSTGVPPPPPPASSSTAVPPPPPASSSTGVPPPPPPASSSTAVPPPPPASSSTGVPPPPPPASSSTAVPPPPPASSSTAVPPPPASSSSGVPPPPPSSSTGSQQPTVTTVSFACNQNIFDNFQSVFGQPPSVAPFYVVQCPTGCTSAPQTTGKIWGTGWYTLDSDICTANKHANGLNGGSAVIQFDYNIFSKRVDHFDSTTANGVTSLSWGSSYPIIFHLSPFSGSLLEEQQQYTYAKQIYDREAQGSVEVPTEAFMNMFHAHQASLLVELDEQQQPQSQQKQPVSSHVPSSSRVTSRLHKLRQRLQPN